MATDHESPKAHGGGKHPARAKPQARSKTRTTPARSATSIVALALTGITAIGALAFGLLRGRAASRNAHAGTVPIDLMQGSHPDGSARAIDAFRPDSTAPVPAEERQALRPAPAGAAAPTLVAGQADEHRRHDAAPS